MRRSTDAILTSHAGSLPRPDDLIDANHQRELGRVEEGAFQKKLTQSVADVVRRQVAAGITVPGDGEYGKSMGSKINYRAWWSYSFERLSNLRIEDIDRDTMPAQRSSPGNTVLSTFADRRSRFRRRSMCDEHLALRSRKRRSFAPVTSLARARPRLRRRWFRRHPAPLRQ